MDKVTLSWAAFAKPEEKERLILLRRRIELRKLNIRDSQREIEAIRRRCVMRERRNDHDGKT
jgi:hypothetical protein